MSNKPITAFISYKSENEEHNKWVERLATDLRKYGIDALLDTWEVRLGDSFTDYMTSKISEADVFLFIITTKSVKAVETSSEKGGAVKFEMQIATARKIAGEKMRIIGIYREGKETPAHIRDLKYADFRNDEQYEKNLEKLINDLNGISYKPPLETTKSEKQDIIKKPRVEIVEIKDTDNDINNPKEFVDNLLNQHSNEKQKNTLLNSFEGVDRSIKEYQILTERIKVIVTDANTRDSDIKFFYQQKQPFLYDVSVQEITIGKVYDLSIAWKPTFGNSLKGSYLYIDMEKRLWIHRIHGHDSDHFHSERFVFDLILPETYGWRRYNQDEQFFTSDELAFYCVRLLLENIR